MRLGVEPVVPVVRVVVLVVRAPRRRQRRRQAEVRLEVVLLGRAELHGGSEAAAAGGCCCCGCAAACVEATVEAAGRVHREVGACHGGDCGPLLGRDRGGGHAGRRQGEHGRVGRELRRAAAHVGGVVHRALPVAGLAPAALRVPLGLVAVVLVLPFPLVVRCFGRHGCACLALALVAVAGGGVAVVMVFVSFV